MVLLLGSISLHPFAIYNAAKNIRRFTCHYSGWLLNILLSLCISRWGHEMKQTDNIS
jgi:hypothetical protein